MFYESCIHLYPFLQQAKQENGEPDAEIKQIGPVLIAPLEDHSEDKSKRRGEKKVDDGRVERVATAFLQEKSRLGPLMFIPGRVLHIEEGERVGDVGSGRWALFSTVLEAICTCTCTVCTYCTCTYM